MKIYFLIVLAFTKCNLVNNQTTTNPQIEPSDCFNLLKNDSISIISNIDFASCNLNTLLYYAGINPADSIATTLGSNQTPTIYWTLHQKNGINITFWSQNKSLVKIDVARSYEAKDDISEFKKINGEPSLKLDYYFDVVKMKNKTAVYGKQGIALFYGMSDASVNNWSYFAPKTTAKFYQENLHPVNALREFEK